MNEFIVWFPNIGRFMRVEESSTHLMNVSNGRLVCNTDELENSCEDDVLEYYLNGAYTLHQAIGKTDMDNKKIYADCSIVEFKMHGTKSIVKVQGYFYWSDISLSYRWQNLTLDGKLRIEKHISWESAIGLKFKIIDTIQENKLGLIK